MANAVSLFSTLNTFCADFLCRIEFHWRRQQGLFRQFVCVGAILNATLAARIHNFDARCIGWAKWRQRCGQKRNENSNAPHCAF